jgi:hypothetical protein
MGLDLLETRTCLEPHVCFLFFSFFFIILTSFYNIYNTTTAGSTTAVAPNSHNDNDGQG